jgi:hypothetical protein
MVTNLVRFDISGDLGKGAWWGVVSGSGVSPLARGLSDDGAANREQSDDRLPRSLGEQPFRRGDQLCFGSGALWRPISAPALEIDLRHQLSH